MKKLFISFYLTIILLQFISAQVDQATPVPKKLTSDLMLKEIIKNKEEFIKNLGLAEKKDIEIYINLLDKVNFTITFFGILMTIIIFAVSIVVPLFGYFRNKYEFNNFTTEVKKKILPNLLNKKFKLVYEKKLLNYINNLSDETLLVLPKVRDIFSSCLRRMTKEICKNLALKFDKEEVNNIKKSIENVVKEWEITSQIFSSDRKQVMYGLTRLYDYVFPGIYHPLKELKKRYNDDGEVYAKIDEAVRVIEESGII